MLQTVFTQRYSMRRVRAESVEVARGASPAAPAASAADVYRAVAQLQPANDAQRAFQARALGLIDDFPTPRFAPRSDI